MSDAISIGIDALTFHSEGGKAMQAIHESIDTERGQLAQVLLMEDEVNLAKGLQMVLSEEGYGVDLAMTGASALEKFNARPFDLLVADLRLPDFDGMEVIKRVKSERPETEVVVITGYASVASAVEAMKIGVRDYLPKPFTEDEFKSIIDGIMKERQERRDIATEANLAMLETHTARLIQKREVTRVLTRVSEDQDFWRELAETGSRALDEYRLSPEAKSAIVSGDLKWLNDHVGELTQKQLMFIHKTLEREIW
jgi:YesN/AraC family two-component response regulator